MRKIVLTIMTLTLTSRMLLGQQAYDWSKLDGGLNGKVYAITVLPNGVIVVGGGFTQAGGQQANFIAQWNGTSWSQFYGGMNDTVYALMVYNSELYVGGKFTQAGTLNNVNHVVRWNSSSFWRRLPGTFGNGVNGEVRTLSARGNYLYAGGKFDSAANVSAWNIANWNTNNQNEWQPCGSGVNDTVFAMAIYDNDIIPAGKFTIAGGFQVNYIAGWTGSNWYRLGSLSNNGTNDAILALTIHNSDLYAGGRFTSAGGNSANHLARWNGSWSDVGGGVDDWVSALASYNNELIVAGAFRFAGSNWVYGDRIARWNGWVWNRMVAGMNNNVSALYSDVTGLYAGGDFTTAGGRYANRMAKWWNQPAYSISGQVRFADNNQPVNRGFVKALRMDVNTREAIVLDTFRIQPANNGNYLIPRVVEDTSVYIVTFPDDEDFVPTYYPSDTSWQTAVPMNTSGNLSGVDIFVHRMTGQTGAYSISGHVYLNYTPPLVIPFNPPPYYPYKKDAIVYAKQGGVFREFAVTNMDQAYTMNSLPSGTYELFATRLGYTSSVSTVTITGGNLDSIDFYLDTASVIGIEKIGSSVPDGFALHQNYPNPFNPVTTIRFDVPQFPLSKGGQRGLSARVVIYDLLGREVATLISESFQPGSYEVLWDASNYPSGVYFYTLTAGDFKQTRKAVLIK